MNCANHVDVPAVAYCRTCGKPLCSVCSRDVRGVIYCEECLASHLSGVVPPVGATAVPPGTDPSLPSPTLAAILGVIPGVGAMYNGEFAKGFVHVLIFATLIWMSDHVSGVFGVGIAAFVIYMPLEAYKTAKARQLGLPAPDPLGFNTWFGPGPANRTSGYGTPGYVSSTGNVAPGAAANVAATPPPANVNPGVVPPYAPVEPVAPLPPLTPLAGPEDEPRSRVPVGAFVLIGLGVLFLLDEVGMLHFDWIWRFWPLILIAIGIRVLMQRQARGR
jgi:TM2 domain-containing membrane protein YozV